MWKAVYQTYRFFKLRGLELKYEQKREISKYDWMFVYRPLTRTVCRKIDVCSTCGSKINTYINELVKNKGEFKDDTLA